MGHSKRDGLTAKGVMNVPGPGNYTMNMSTRESSPRFGFGSSKRGNAGRASAAPGPGNYAIAPMVGTEGLKMSMHQKLNSSLTGGTLSPGPGAYESSLSNKKKEPQYGLGTSKRPALNMATLSPGSGAYNPNATFTAKKNAEWRFGTDSRKGLAQTTLSPGPGGYNIDSPDFNGSKSRFYIGNKLPALKGNTNVPGAGAYNPEPEKLKKKLPAFSMAQKLGSSLTSSGNIAPGAGTYDISLNNKNASPRFGFGTSKRAPPAKATDGPGPGSYRLPSTVGDVPNYSMPNRSDA